MSQHRSKTAPLTEFDMMLIRAGGRTMDELENSTLKAQALGGHAILYAPLARKLRKSAAHRLHQIADVISHARMANAKS